MNSVKTLLRNSLDQENLHDLMIIACDGPLPKEFLSDLLLNGHNKKIVLMKIKISKCSVPYFYIFSSIIPGGMRLYP